MLDDVVLGSSFGHNADAAFSNNETYKAFDLKMQSLRNRKAVGLQATFEKTGEQSPTKSAL